MLKYKFLTLLIFVLSCNSAIQAQDSIKKTNKKVIVLEKQKALSYEAYLLSSKVEKKISGNDFSSTRDLITDKPNLVLIQKALTIEEFRKLPKSEKHVILNSNSEMKNKTLNQVVLKKEKALTLEEYTKLTKTKKSIITKNYN